MAEIERALESGALVHVDLDESNAETPAPLKRFAFTELNRRDAWIAKDGEIQRWSTIQSDFRASFESRGPRRIQVDVTNGARKIAENVVVRLHVNRPVIAAKVAKTQVLQQTASLRFEELAEGIDIILPRLEQRRARSSSVPRRES